MQGFFSYNEFEWLKTAGENLSHDFYSEEGVIKNWLESPGHRENILDPGFKEIGVTSIAGRLFGSDTVVVVQMFGAP